MKKIVLLLFCLLTLIQQAFSVEYSDAQAWGFINVKGDLHSPYLPEYFDDRLVSNLEFHYRLKNEMSDFQTLILRPSVGYKLDNGKTVWLGYAYSEEGREDGTRGEIRFFQMISFKQSLGKAPIVLVGETRLEQRFFEDLPGVTLRFRQMLKLSLGLHNQNNHKVSFFGKYEYFYNITHADAQNNGGFDQSRTVLGLSYKTKLGQRDIEFSAGYMHNLDSKEQYQNGIAVGMSINLSKKETKAQESRRKTLEKRNREFLENGY